METKKIDVIQTFSLKSLVEKANATGIQKDDIVTLFFNQSDDTYSLVYYV